MTRALEGIRVLEMTTAVAGPTAGFTLGDMGAEVIKVEEPTQRNHVGVLQAQPLEGAPDHPYNRVPNFNELNRSKLQVSLNVAKPEGRDIFLRLAAVSDVVIENFAPRVMGNLGIDYPDLKEVNPSIIMVSMPAFGKSGPYKNRGSYGPGIDAMSGLSHLTGYPDRAPGKPGNFFCDQNAGLHAAFSTLAALRHRRRTGEGQYIELAMLEGELQSVAPAIMDVVLNGRNQMRMANRHAWLAPQGVYPCRGDDEWVAISVQSDAQWRALCGVLGRDDLAADEGYATQEARHARHDELDRIISEWTAARTKHEVQEQFQAAGVSAGAALTVPELFENPHQQHRKTFTWSDHPEIGPFPHTRTAWRSRRGNHGISRHAPLFGGGNDYVFRDLLGMSEDDVQTLVDQQVTSYAPILPVTA